MCITHLEFQYDLLFYLKFSPRPRSLYFKFILSTENKVLITNLKSNLAACHMSRKKFSLTLFKINQKKITKYKQ